MSDLNVVLDRLEPTMGPPESEPVALEGGITNRNYRARLGGRDVVIRVPGRDTDLLGIDRAAEGEAAELAASLGIGPEVVARLADPACLVTAFAEGAPVEESELRDGPVLQRVAEALRRLHDCGASLPSRFDVLEVVRGYAAIAEDRDADLPDVYPRALARAEALARPYDPVPCHNDLLAGNLLVNSERLHLLDWEYAGMGDRWFDLGNLAVNNELDAAAEGRLLTAYFGRPPDGDDRERLTATRFLSDFREAMWGVVQSVTSDLDFDFDGYAREHFARLRI